MARFGRGRYVGSRSVRPAHVYTATEAERAHAKQIIIARVEHLDHSPILQDITGMWPRPGQVVAFHLDIARGGKPKALMFVIPNTAPASMLKTEITVTTGQPPEGAIPVAQFRSLCFYRIIDKMKEWLETADPEDEKEMLHFMALFEHQVKDAMRKRILVVTPPIEKQWERYGKLRDRYLLLREDGEKAHAKGFVVRLAKGFLTSMNGKG